MRKSLMMILVAVLFVSAMPAGAELQNVVTGGSITIRGNWFMDAFTGPAAREVRWPGFFLPTRAIGDFFGGQTIWSPFSWGEESNDAASVEQYTRLSVRADFTNEVSAFVELDSYDVWGEDFRSDYITGADFKTATADDLEVYQSYIEANEMFGYPVRARIGRQALSFGNEWLVGTSGTNSGLFKTSFDGIRLTYATDQFSVDAWWSKLADNSPAEQDADIDFYGVYASYLGIENNTIDAYWLLVRDARGLNDTNLTWFPERVEDILGVDDYDVTNLHTIGLRGAGTYGAFDYNAELAYQFGDANQQGFLFSPFVYGDDGANFSNWALNTELGYTFDMSYTPRVYLGFSYFGGEDNRDISFWDWINPFDSADSSVSFNRLFSSVEYSQFLDTNADLSNFWVIRGGVKANPTESTEVLLSLSYFESAEQFSAPRHFNIGKFRVPIAPSLSFWDQENSSDLGWELGLTGTYHYSEDLKFQAGYSHLFVGDGLSEGNYNKFNGLVFDGGRDDNDADYLFFETSLAF